MRLRRRSIWKDGRIDSNRNSAEEARSREYEFTTCGKSPLCCECTTPETQLLPICLVVPRLIWYAQHTIHRPGQSLNPRRVTEIDCTLRTRPVRTDLLSAPLSSGHFGHSKTNLLCRFVSTPYSFFPVGHVRRRWFLCRLTVQSGTFCPSFAHIPGPSATGDSQRTRRPTFRSFSLTPEALAPGNRPLIG